MDFTHADGGCRTSAAGEFGKSTRVGNTGASNWGCPDRHCRTHRRRTQAIGDWHTGAGCAAPEQGTASEGRRVFDPARDPR